ncbi:PREDICTED: uncharacterized protein LOC106743652 [Dinoponera quadriceps]|uniref:Uncharacterized protein LOC106743652 n=1 Tax=Dinoponera quadriceps TaxID=609295 RepID=A0A6P3X4I1_DINQU|nr:PREDICTED: uncharacterized protein LOC106743652 [Dinoponera quadriceps]XP_014473203.1 PREDICTED: uncharacterized protein LOC106743652 [Dinoponera quadriceps]
MQEPGYSPVKIESELDIKTESEELEDVQETNEKLKGTVTNALNYCQRLLRSANLLTDTPPNEISSASVAMGEKIFKEIKVILEDIPQDIHRTLLTDEGSFSFEGSDNKVADEEREEEPDRKSPDFVAEQLDTTIDYIPLSYKEKVVALAEAHPKWSLKTLKKRGCSRLRDKKELARWKNDIKRGGTVVDKWKHIETETYERFKEAKEHLEQVSTRTLQQWAMAAAFPFLCKDFTFSASKTWITRFKQKYCIREED